MDDEARERLRHSEGEAGSSNQPDPISLRDMPRAKRRRLLRHYSPFKVTDPYFLDSKESGGSFGLLALAVLAAIIFITVFRLLASLF